MPNISTTTQLKLEQILLVARSMREYQLMFGLDETREPLKSLLTSPNSKVLDCAGSIGTFGISIARKSREIGGSLEVVSVDPVYRFPIADILERNKAGIDSFLKHAPDNPGWAALDWVDPQIVELFPTPSDCIRYRLAVCDQWRKSYIEGEQGVSWVDDTLPKLTKVPAKEFDLILVGNLLFAYADGNHFGNSADDILRFHYDSIMRLSKLLKSDRSELRIYPIGTESSSEFKRLNELTVQLEMSGLSCERIPSDYRFVRRWTHMLKIRMI